LWPSVKYFTINSVLSFSIITAYCSFRDF
jgi:hypothetical protein